jgi:hypothetical protein
MSNRRSKRFHVMALVKSWPGGWDEFFCPECRRRFLISWPPEQEKIVLEKGDVYTDHRYSSDLIAPQPAAQPETPEDEPDPRTLEPFEEWLSNNLD